MSIENGVDWDSVRELEANLLQEMTIHENLLSYQALHKDFEWHLQQTADLFAENHRQALVDLQNRLDQLKNWQSKCGKPISIDSKDSKTAA